MNLNKLEKITDYEWRLRQPLGQTHHPIIFYASEPLLIAMDERVISQITHVAQLPGLAGAAMTMPDAHWGYGFPIGGVAAFDPEQGGIISAGGVGFDISCGIRCLRTNLRLTDILPVLEKLGIALYHTIPAGAGVEGKLQLSNHELDKVLEQGALWAVKQGFGNKEELAFVEEHGCMSGAAPDNVSETAKRRQHGEMGTLGSGNHYLEVQIIDKIFDSTAANAYGLFDGQVLISIHCGSRGLGHQIGSDYLVSLAKAATRLGIYLPDRELACAPILSPEGQCYLGAMRAGINCALANRQILAHLTRQIFMDLMPGTEIETLYDVSHNTCKAETHQIAGTAKELYIHRKGATRAFGPNHPALPKIYQAVGQPVIIGGSMGTGSYILAGNSAEKNHAFASASHGAGRAMSRHQALRQFHGRELVDKLAQQGIYIYSRTLRGVAEEAPEAYKDVDEVALATEKAGLARRVALLRPKLCVKG